MVAPVLDIGRLDLEGVNVECLHGGALRTARAEGLAAGGRVFDVAGMWDLSATVRGKEFDFCGRERGKEGERKKPVGYIPRHAGFDMSSVLASQQRSRNSAGM